jgi:hypothetical protein
MKNHYQAFLLAACAWKVKEVLDFTEISLVPHSLC